MPKRNNVIAKKPRRSLFFTIFLMIGLLVSQDFIFAHTEAVTPSIYLKYGFSINNPTNQAIEKVVLRTYAPAPLTSTQECKEINANYDFQILKDDAGNQMLEFQFPVVPPFGSKNVQVSAKVLQKITSDSSVIENKEEYLNAEPFIETQDPVIKSLADKMKDENTLKTANNIYDWLVKHLKSPGYVAEEKGASYALKNLEGDCTEHMYLAMALCRANGIPARGLAGYHSESNQILNPVNYHNWAEFYDGEKWRLLDSQGKLFNNENSGLITFRILDGTSSAKETSFHHYQISDPRLKVRISSR